MNSEPNLMVLGAIFGALISLLCALAIKVALNLWTTIKFELEYLKHPRLVAHDEIKLCQDPHRWVDVQLALRGLSPGHYKVCQECGCILNNSEFVVSSEVLQQAKEALEILQKRDAEKKELTDRIFELSDRSINNEITRTLISLAGTSQIGSTDSRKMLKDLIDFSFKAIDEATDKVTAENKARLELEKKYDSWASKVKSRK